MTNGPEKEKSVIYRRAFASLLGPLVAVLAMTFPGPALGQVSPEYTPVAQHGFDDPQNSYSWSMAWFKGRLYVGTARSFACVEAATYDFYWPNIGFYPGAPQPDLNCPPDRYSLDLRAEIWQYTPQSGVWRRVYQSPVIPNPRAPGRMIARDIGFRGMIVYRDPSGRQALYVGGVTADEYIPELAPHQPPEILRSTDGTLFKPLHGSPGMIQTVFGAQWPIGYRAMEAYDGRLFVTASAGLAGDGVILEVKRAWSDHPQFVQVSPSTMRVYEIASFNGSLYAGGGSDTTGYGVWQATASGAQLNFRPVLDGGAGRGPAMTSVLAMDVYQGRLYVSATGWYGVLFPETELIRINPDNTWDLVVGNARMVPGVGFKYPLSGLPDGFGNIFNAHLWRANVYGNAMYIGTNDMSWTFRNVPLLGSWLQPLFGFDVYGTCDGTYWWPVTTNAFGDGRYNFGSRTLVSTPFGQFIGSTNHVEGTKVWRSVGPASVCGSTPQNWTSAAPVIDAPHTLADSKLLATEERCGTVLSWQPPEEARQYRVLRAAYRQAPYLLSHAPQTLPNGEVPDMPIIRRGPTAGLAAPWVLGPFRQVGTTKQAAFVDRHTGPVGRYLYELTAVGTAERSNLALTSTTPPETFDDVRSKINTLARLSGGRRAHAARADRTAALSIWRIARTRWRRGDRTAAVSELQLLQRRVRTLATAATGWSNTSARQDLAVALYRLQGQLMASENCRPDQHLH
jgi:hypothetical protein